MKFLTIWFGLICAILALGGTFWLLAELLRDYPRVLCLLLTIVVSFFITSSITEKQNER